MNNINYSWLENDWRRLDAQRSRLPHAILIQGAPGIGKRHLATLFAQSLLCGSRSANGFPCGECNSCAWFADGSHPDFRALLPEALEPDAADEGEGEERSVRKKLPSREIKIDQIRALDTFFNVGTHRGGAKIVMIYPAEALNIASSNALLKVLEEPASGTVFLLVTSYPEYLLPTIRSRTARFPVSRPDPELCIEWLAAQGVANPGVKLAEAGGAPLAVSTGAESDALEAIRSQFIESLASSTFDPLLAAERCEKAGNENLVLWMMRWVVDLIGARQGDLTPRFYPAWAADIDKRLPMLNPQTLHAYYRTLVSARRVASHPLNPRLFAEELLIDYGRIVPNPR